MARQARYGALDGDGQVDYPTPETAKILADGGQVNDVTYRVWCEHEGCDFEEDGSARNALLAQKKANGYIVGHGLDTGHHETYRSVDTDTDRSEGGDRR